MLASRNALSRDFSRIISLIESGQSIRNRGSRTACLRRDDCRIPDLAEAGDRA